MQTFTKEKHPIFATESLFCLLLRYRDQKSDGPKSQEDPEYQQVNLSKRDHGIMLQIPVQDADLIKGYWNEGRA